MNLKKKIREFFTLTRKANGGFTLVELIVVIAILAILAGVAVPAYSGYITQTNKQADVTLAKDIEHALTLGYYEGTVVPGDYVIVYPDKNVKVEGAKTAEAMTAAFGAGYESLRLKYSEWDNSVVGVVADYNGSSFSSNEKALLNDVQGLTDAFAAFIDGKDASMLEGIAGDEFIGFLEDNNIDPNNQQAVANALALYASYRSRSADKQAFIEAWRKQNASYVDFSNIAVGEKKLGLVGGLAATYARGEALVRYAEAKVVAAGKDPAVTDSATGKTYPSLSAWFSAQDVNGTDTEAVKAKINALNDKTSAYLTNPALPFAPFLTGYFWNADAGQGNEASQSQAAKDAAAYLSVLGAIEDSTPALMKDLNSGNMYGDGKMESFLNSYISAGEALKDQGNAIMVQMQENGTAISIPLYNLGLMG